MVHDLASPPVTTTEYPALGKADDKVTVYVRGVPVKKVLVIYPDLVDPSTTISPIPATIFQLEPSLIR